MPENCFFKQVEERPVGTEIEHMAWSPRMDLIALANVHGEVHLHRLTWQKVWTLPAPGEEILVSAMAWRPDSKVLALGYNNGRLIMCDVENAAILHETQISNNLKSLTWITEASQEEGTSRLDDVQFNETASTYLPPLPPLPQNYSDLNKAQSEDKAEDAKKLKGFTELNVLVAGCSDGEIVMLAFGVFPLCSTNLTKHGLDKEGSIVSAQLSQDLNMISLIVESPTSDDCNEAESYLLSFDSSLLASRHQSILILALKLGDILTLMMYLDATIHQMTEAWEDILLEIDSKLLKFAEEKARLQTGSVSNDFLRLLMLGFPSDELETFLTHELTDKGLKKLGHSIETSYSNIQKLLLKHLHSVGQSLMYQLNELRGMAFWYETFGILGLSTQALQDAVCQAGSFMLKASELQQVIDGSLKNFKAFFRWLYVVIKGFQNEPVPAELTKMTQQDLNFVAQFLKEYFTESDGVNPSFKLERVGQYLKDNDLADPVDGPDNEWVKFLKDNPALKDSKNIYDVDPNKSLVQVYNALQTSITKVLSTCSDVISKTLECTTCSKLGRKKISTEKRIAQFSHLTEEGATNLYSVIAHDIPCSTCTVLRQNTSGNREIGMCKLKFGPLVDEGEQGERSHLLLDVKHYDGATVTMLLVEDDLDQKMETPVIAQLTLSAIDNEQYMMIPQQTTDCLLDLKDCPVIDASELIEGSNWLNLGNIKANSLAVSGTRKVASVLFSSRRRIRFFMTELDDDDEEEDESQINDMDTSSALVTAAPVPLEISTQDDEDKENTSSSL